MSVHEADLSSTGYVGGIMPVRYDMSTDELGTMEAQLVDQVHDEHGEGVSAVWMPPYGNGSNVVRAYEAGIFPELPEIMEPYEGVSKFLALVDTRPSAERIVHAYRISSPSISAESGTADDLSIAFIQDLLSSGQIEGDEIREYYASHGIDLNRCVSVESNFRIGKPAERVNGVPVAQIGYLSLFNEVSDEDPRINDTLSVFTHLNKPAIVSLGRLGVVHVPFAGRDDLQTPTAGEQQFDPKYKPVAIPVGAPNDGIFVQLQEMSPPTLHL